MRSCDWPSSEWMCNSIETVKSVDKNKSFVIHNNVILYQKGLTPSTSLNRTFQHSLQLHFVWIDVVGAVSNINLFKLMLSAEFTTPFHLNWCCQQSLQLHFVWIDVVSRVYISISLKLMLSNAFLASFHFFSVVKRFFFVLFQMFKPSVSPHHVLYWYMEWLNLLELVLFRDIFSLSHCIYPMCTVYSFEQNVIKIIIKRIYATNGWEFLGFNLYFWNNLIIR